MQELSLHILDLAENSIAASAAHISIHLSETADGWLTLTVRDDGKGTDATAVTDPFYTTHKTKSVGLGVPLAKLAAELTGGDLTVESSRDANAHGTCITARFNQASVNAKPLGAMPETVMALLSEMQGADLDFLHTSPHGCVRLNTEDVRSALGGIPLQNAKVLSWVREYLAEQYEHLS